METIIKEYQLPRSGKAVKVRELSGADMRTLIRIAKEDILEAQEQAAIKSVEIDSAPLTLESLLALPGVDYLEIIKSVEANFITTVPKDSSSLATSQDGDLKESMN